MKVIKNKKYAGFSIAALIIASTLLYIIPPHFNSSQAKECTAEEISGDTCTSDDGSASGEWQWQVNVEETLKMVITPNTTSQTGDVNKFLRNQVKVDVSTNNGSGYTVGMTTNSTDTDLKNGATDSLPTLATDSTCADETCEAFPVNFWGYSFDDSSNTGTYKALVANTVAPITVVSSESNGTASKDVFFGAKANAEKSAGTYTGTVVFSVTTGTKGAALPAPAGDPSVPQGPNSPSISEQPSVSQTPAASNTYSYTTGTRTYRSTASSVATNTDQDSTENNVKKRSTASDFVSPLGVNEKTYTTTNIQRGSIITTILMCIAFLAAGIGIFFFILAKRRDEEEDEIQEV